MCGEMLWRCCRGAGLTDGLITSPHTHSSSFYPYLPCVVSGVLEAAGLIKWKWSVITKVMTAAVGRHHIPLSLRKTEVNVKQNTVFEDFLCSINIFFSFARSVIHTIHHRVRRVCVYVSLPHVNFCSRSLFMPCFPSWHSTDLLPWERSQIFNHQI